MDMKPQRLTCPTCGKVHLRCASWRYGAFCSRKCYESLPFPRLYPHIKHEDVQRVARLYLCQKDAAKALGVSYVRFRRVVEKLGLRGSFAPHGGAATWAATWEQM